MAKENKSTTILLLVIAGALLFLVGSFTGNAVNWGNYFNKQITLDNIGSTGAIAITINNIKNVISPGDTKIINGIKITNNILLPACNKQLTLDSVHSCQSIKVTSSGISQAISAGTTRAVNGISVTNGLSSNC